MSRLFNKSYTGKTSDGKAAFGQFSEPKNAGDYILDKKAKYTYCRPTPCLPKIAVSTQGNYLLLKQANNLQYFDNINRVDSIKQDLNYGLISKLDLKNVSVIKNNETGKSPTPLSLPAIPYLNYTIDPSGNLFGNTTCGINNYENYVVYNSQYSTSNPGHINNV